MGGSSCDLLLRNGRIATAAGWFVGSIATRHGRISGVWSAGEEPELDADRMLDCTDRWVLPGGVDPHVHVGISFGAVQTTEDHVACSSAALSGGTTTIVDFAIPRPGQTPLDAVEERRRLAEGRCATDYALHGCFTDRNEDDLDQIPAMVERGVRTVKVYTTYRNELMASDQLVRQIMTALQPFDGLTYVHAEDNSMIEELMARYGAQGEIPYRLIREARPESAENEAVRQVIATAGELAAPVYFVHQSTGTALDLGRSARARGQRVYAEVCPHYALLDESVFTRADGECFTCCPPLRARATVDAVLAGVMTGSVDTIASDHCAFHRKDKSAAAHDLRTMPFGMPGVQTRVPIMLSELVVRRRVPMSAVVELLCARPARLSGLYPRKGAIRVGADADLLVWTAKGRSMVQADRLVQDSDYTPFEGWEVHGHLDQVILGGVIVRGEGAVHQPVMGRILDSGPITDF